MPNRFLDSQVSMNSSATGAISIPVTTTPTLFATLGLNASAAGPELEIQYTVTSTLTNLVATSIPVTFIVQRVFNGVTTTIYSATHDNFEIVASPNNHTVVTFNGTDFLPPAGFLIYQVLISTTVDDAIIRIGPESMIAAAYSN